jgi:DegV family protein with EDD domain
VAVVVDSAASLPPQADDDPQLYIAPLQLIIDGRTHLDGRDMTPTQFYRQLRAMKEPPTTASPSPETYLESFRAAAAHASSVLCLTVSPRFSSSFDSALAAARRFREEAPDVGFKLLDSQSAAGGEGLVAMEALRAAKRGAGLEEVAETVTRTAPRVSLLAFLDTLYYVWKGGRVARLAYAGSALLGIKPMLEMSKGEVRNVARPRTRRRATRKLLEIMRERVGESAVHANVMHGDCREDADELRRAIEAGFDCEELLVTEFSPVMGAHTGPGTLGVAFWSEDS